ncbi:MAG: YbhB/YbcL family Raf kinase inhibitor-like protein [Bacteroidetes bacterium]|nr:YbhB/YbcL family Raf kinase inhibitor-like protein [Bacteroidota bacterium]
MATVATKTLTIESPVFTNNNSIPSKYTCDGTNVNPALTIKDIPVETKSLALIMDDPDAPNGTFDHWLMWDIPVRENIEENSMPGIQGKNSKGENKYTGPCPPSGTHHYHFRVYALDTKLNLSPGTDKSALLKAMEDHILAEGELTGLYKK